MLSLLRNLQNLNDPFDCVMFVGMFRKSNVLVQQRSYTLGKHLSRQDVHITPAGVVLVIKWSKTIQFGERCLLVPLPWKPDHRLCPTTAVIRALAMTSSADPVGPAFVAPQAGRLVSLSPTLFVKTIKQLLQRLQYDPSLFSGHSFRRGGATWAFQCHLPGEVIQLMGDWRSDSYRRYIHIPLATRRSFSQTLVDQLQP